MHTLGHSGCKGRGNALLCNQLVGHNPRNGPTGLWAKLACLIEVCFTEDHWIVIISEADPGSLAHSPRKLPYR